MAVLVTRLIFLTTAPTHLAAAAPFNLAVVVDVLCDLTEIAHVEPLHRTPGISCGGRRLS